jgi:CHAT domain-containing protein
VDDRASALLMSRFYTAMLSKGIAPAAALREAQLQMLREPRWASPHYWAAFGLQGEWK